MKMDKTNIRRVRVGYTHNCGNYESVRLDLEFELETPETKHLDDNLDDYIKELAAYVQSECRKMAPEYRVKAIELNEISEQLRASRQAIIAIKEIASHAPILREVSNYVTSANQSLLALDRLHEDADEDSNEDEDNENIDEEEYPSSGDDLPM
ncbi:MAG TPA: hypothetical protein IGS52_12400 [Oscillatoriaceae cyanobacterium M33_DOE_052]|uniref:Uncharacterized protein n=1 Tax=Planktothricoides sp. SpSt-374 TaxID=2282167 RepID=A0A7C3VT11_9CYAN|nr:hypothetical protein [Oscillatoriaceae cyanobacterium M33_DOE_052]